MINNYFKISDYIQNKSQGLFALIFLMCFPLISFCQNSGNANTVNNEKKVDYLLKIYFSGENKEGLNTKILVALQELEPKLSNPNLAKQFSFLNDIKEIANNAEDACDILDILSVGIFNIDAIESSNNGVKLPTEKAKKSSVNALAGLNTLQSASRDINANARELAYNSLYYANSAGLYSGASKVAGTAANVGNAINTVSQTAQTLQKIGSIGKSMGINIPKKDKPCSEVKKKEIVIGEHFVMNLESSPKTPIINNENTTVLTNPSQLTTETLNKTVLTIKGVTSSALRTLTEALKTKQGVLTAEKSFNEASSTITITHTGNTDVFADWIDDNYGSVYKLLDYSNGKINLIAKTK
jgi:hypothetical protein